MLSTILRHLKELPHLEVLSEEEQRGIGGGFIFGLGGAEPGFGIVNPSF